MSLKTVEEDSDSPAVSEDDDDRMEDEPSRSSM
jgi:hypothetical protein